MEIQIKISEVWNGTGESETLAIIETTPQLAKTEVYQWINANRPDLSLARTIYAHGFHACEVIR